MGVMLVGGKGRGTFVRHLLIFQIKAPEYSAGQYGHNFAVYFHFFFKFTDYLLYENSKWENVISETGITGSPVK